MLVGERVRRARSSASCRCSAARSNGTLRQVEHPLAGIEDRPVAGAAAEVSGERAANLRRRSGASPPPRARVERPQRHHEAGRAEAALRAVAVDHRLLHRVQVAIRLPQVLDGEERLAVERRHELDAGVDGLERHRVAVRSRRPPRCRRRSRLRRSLPSFRCARGPRAGNSAPISWARRASTVTTLPSSRKRMPPVSESVSAFACLALHRPSFPASTSRRLASPRDVALAAIVGIPRGLGNSRPRRRRQRRRCPIPLIFHDYVGRGIATIAKPCPNAAHLRTIGPPLPGSRATMRPSIARTRDLPPDTDARPLLSARPRRLRPRTRRTRNGRATRGSPSSSSSTTRKAARARCCTATPASEQFLSEIIGAQAFPARHLSMESIYEYGSRAGVWRILREFERRRLAAHRVRRGHGARAQSRRSTAAFVELGHEIACHGWRWISLSERRRGHRARAHARSPSRSLRRATGSAPVGWYTGRDSPNTRRLVVEHGGFLYDSDYYGDDLPFWTDVTTADGALHPHLVVPYTLDTNDMRFATPQGFNTGEQFFAYLRDAFDVLYAEGAERPKMLSIGMHCRLLGRPGRFAALRRFLDHVEAPRPRLGLPPRRHRAALDRAASLCRSREPGHDDARAALGNAHLGSLPGARAR